VKKKTSALLLISFGVIFGVLSPIVIFYGSDLTKSGIGGLTGKLTPPQVNFTQSFEVYFDSVVVVYGADQLKSGVDLATPVQLGDYAPIKIAISNGKLLVSAEVRDQNGEVVAKIHNNDWSVNNNPVIANDRNYNDYAFEVMDSDRIPVLQVYMASNNTIYVNGLFYLGSERILAAPNIMDFNPSDAEINQYLTPIFMYPSGAPNPILGWSMIVVGAIFGVLATILISVGYDKLKSARRHSAR
jgi:hypothetical protein